MDTDRSTDPGQLLTAALDRLQAGSDGDGAGPGPGQLSEAVGLLRRAVAGAGPEDPLRYEILDLLTQVLAARGGGGVLPGDLDDWVDAYQQLLPACPDGPLRDHCAGRLAVGLTQRAGTATGSMPDRDQGIDLLLELVARTRLEESYRIEVRRLLAQQLLLRALPPGMSAQSDAAQIMRAMATPLDQDRRPDVELAIEQLTLALDSGLPVEAAVRGVLAAMLAQAMMLGSFGRPVGGDLDRVIRSLDAARCDLPTGAPGRGELLHQLGRLRADRAAGSGWSVAEISAAVDELSQADRLLTVGHPLRAQLMFDLGQVLLQRAVLTGSVEDERAAIQALESALRLMSGSDRRRAEVLQRLGPALLKTGTAGPDRIVGLIREALTFPAGTRLEAQLRIHLGNALTARYAQTTQDADSTEAIEQYERATVLVPDPDDDLHLLALTTLGSMFADRFDIRHDVQDIDLAIRYLGQVDAALTRRPEALSVPSMPSRSYARSLLAAARFQKAQRDELAGRAQSGLVEAVAGLERVMAELPVDDPMAPRIRAELEAARMLLALRGDDVRAARRSAISLVAEAEAVPEGHPDRPVLLGRAGIALAMTGGAVRDLAIVNEGIALLERALGEPGGGSDATGTVGHTPRLRVRIPLGEALLERHGLDGHPATLDAAIGHLEEAWQECQAQPGHPLTPLTARTLARAYRCRSDQARQDRVSADHVALAGLEAHARNVMLQTGAERGLTAARAAAGDVLLATLRCLDDGRLVEAVTALETGRALVLHAATAAGGVITALDTAGRSDLANRWRAAPVAEDQSEPLLPELDLRHQTLTALAGTTAYQRLMSATQISDLTGSLGPAGRDALVYLIPEMSDEPSGAERGECHRGRALVVWFDGVVVDLDLPDLRITADGAIFRYDAARARAHSVAADDPAAATAFENLWVGLTELCSWAGAVAMTPLIEHLRERVLGRDPRLVIVPVGTLGVVPWHIARLGPGLADVALQAASVSYAASARELIEVNERPRLHPDEGVTLVANPDGTLPFAALGAEAVRDAFYPGATYLGRPRRIAAGPGDTSAVLEQVSGATTAGPAILELDCHATVGDSPANSRLLLTDGELPVEQILRYAAGGSPGRPGGLVLLSACETDLAAEDHDEALTLATAFLAAGAVSVIGSRWAVDDAGAAVFMFMFHFFFNHGRRSPGAALRSTQLWMLDTGRIVPDEMPKSLCGLCTELDLTAVSLWGAFSHHGW